MDKEQRLELKKEFDELLFTLDKIQTESHNRREFHKNALQMGLKYDSNALLNKFGEVVPMNAGLFRLHVDKVPMEDYDNLQREIEETERTLTELKNKMNQYSGRTGI